MSKIKLDLSNPLELKGEQASLLYDFLASQRQATYWEKNAEIKRTEDSLSCWPWAETPKNFELSHRLVVSERGDNKPGLRFHVVSDAPNDLLGSGNYGTVYRVLHTWKIEDGEVKKAKFKKQVVKLQQFVESHKEAQTMMNDTLSENAIGLTLDYLGMKPLVSHKYVQKEEAPAIITNATVMADLGMDLKYIISVLNLKQSELLTECRARETELVESFDKKYPEIEPYIRERFIARLYETDVVLKSNLEQRTKLANERIKLAQSVALAYKQNVSDNGLIHYDIKPANILVDIKTNPATVTFGDVGLSVKINKMDHRRSGTPAYVAPEFFRSPDDNFSSAIDIYSLGRVLGEILGDQVAKNPLGNDYHGKPVTLEKKVITYFGAAEFHSSENSVVFKVGDYPQLSESKKSIMHDVVTQMLETEPVKRPDIDLVVSQFNQLTTTIAPILSDKEKLIHGVFKHLNTIAKYAPLLEEENDPEMARELRQMEDKIRGMTKKLAPVKVGTKEGDNEIRRYLLNCNKEITKVKEKLEAKTTVTHTSAAAYLANFALFLLTAGIPYLAVAGYKAAKTGNPFFFSTTTKKEKVDKTVADLSQDIEALEKVIINPGKR